MPKRSQAIRAALDADGLKRIAGSRENDFRRLILVECLEAYTIDFLQALSRRDSRPTLREFLDTIALQTSSQWKYDPSDKYLHSEVEHKTPVDDLAIFEFTPAKREKPFRIKLANGWKPIDKGNWVMYVPPSFPVGMAIYEMGTYSCNDKAKRKQLLFDVRRDIALEWAQRVSESAKEEDLKPAKVGPYDALYFEAMVDSQLDKKMRWRHWVFLDDARCYFVVSTIFPELEAKILPDVQKMLATFETTKQKANTSNDSPRREIR